MGARGSSLCFKRCLLHMLPFAVCFAQRERERGRQGEKDINSLHRLCNGFIIPPLVAMQQYLQQSSLSLSLCMNECMCEPDSKVTNPLSQFTRFQLRSREKQTYIYRHWYLEYYIPT